MSDDAWLDTSDDEQPSPPRRLAAPVSSSTPPPQQGTRIPTRQTSYSFWDLLPGSANRRERDSFPASGEQGGSPRPTSSLPVITSSTSSSSASSSTQPIPIRKASHSSAEDRNGKAPVSSSSGGSSWIDVDPNTAPSGRPLRRDSSPLSREGMQKAVRKQVDDLMRNPALALSRLKITDDGRFDRLPDGVDVNGTATLPSPITDVTPTSSIIANGMPAAAPPRPPSPGREAQRKAKFLRCLRDDNVDMSQLKALAWAGIPAELRPLTWQILLGYVPTNASRRIAVLARKRQEYADAVKLAFAKGKAGLDQATWHQIYIDVPRTNPGVRLWQFEATQRSLERILYVWAIRHPASGYVQGINDIVTPFFQVFLTSYVDVSPEAFDVGLLPPNVLEALEADSFWCLSKLLDGIQDNYIYAQPGIQRQVARMKELCARVDAPLAAHLEEQNVEFIQFAWRWQNCLLLREVPVNSVVRMWDTYFAEGTDTFAEFHLFVCLAFLVKWSDKLRSMDFQGIIMFLQSLPSTQVWSDEATVMLLSEAYLWRSIWADSAHLQKFGQAGKV